MQFLEKKQLKGISKTVVNLKPHELDLIRTEELKNKLKQELPDLEFEVEQNVVNLGCVPDGVNRRKLCLLDKFTLSVGVRQMFQISESTSKLFGKDESKTYLMEQLRNKDTCATWMCIGRNIVVFASDDKNLKKAIEVMKSEVVETHLNLGEVYIYIQDDVCQSPLWKYFIRCLCKEDKLLEIDLTNSVIFVACLRRSIEKTRRRIEDFIIRNSLYSESKFLRSLIQSKWAIYK